MSWIQLFIQITVSILLLKFVAAYPANAGSSSPPDCDTRYPYCCSPPLNSPSIPFLFSEMNTVIDLLESACTDKTFKNNVSLRNL